MRKGQYIEVISGEYYYSSAGSLGRINQKNGGRCDVAFDYVVNAGDLVRAEGKPLYPVDLDIYIDDIQVIPKAIYDIKLKAIQHDKHINSTKN